LTTQVASPRARKSFSRIEHVLDLPNLIDIQKASFDWFMEGGLRETIDDISPIEDYTGTLAVEFAEYEFGEPQFTIQECREKDLTYQAPLSMTVRFVNKETGEIREQTVFMGDFPMMTEWGTFIINGTERVIVSQLHRSPGVFFKRGAIYVAKIIPYRGSWLDIEFDAKDIVYARIDRRRKIPVTSLLYALGLDGEQILATFYKHVSYKRQKEGWRVPFDANRLKGYKAVNNLVDADTGRTVVEAGHKLTVRQARQLAEKGLSYELDVWGHDVSHDWPWWRKQLAHHLPRFC